MAVIFRKKEEAQDVLQELISQGRKGKIQKTWGGWVINIGVAYLEHNDVFFKIRENSNAEYS